MKLSSNSVGMLIFIALATTVFVLMALRPAVEGNAMNLGVPMNSEKANSGAAMETTTMSTAQETATETFTETTENMTTPSEETPSENTPPSDEPASSESSTTN